MSNIEVITNTIDACPLVELAGVYRHDQLQVPDLLNHIPSQSDRIYELQRVILACIPTTDLDTWTVQDLEVMLGEATAHGLDPIKVEPFRHHGNWMSRGRVHYLEPIGHLSLKGSIQLTAEDVIPPSEDLLERELDIARRITVTLAPRIEYLEALLSEGAENSFPAELRIS